VGRVPLGKIGCSSEYERSRLTISLFAIFEIYGSMQVQE
jgi:hypothetical protein